MILIAGDGRKVGKTLYACQLINSLSDKQQVSGIKVSPHIHNDYPEESLLYKDEEIIVCEEKEISHKDSSKMLQAGARRVFFIMSKQKDLGNAFSKVLPFLNDDLIVCESGGLREFVEPGKFIFIKNNALEVQKKEYLKFDPTLLFRKGKTFITEPNTTEDCKNPDYINQSLSYDEL